HLWDTCYARDDAKPQDVIPFYNVPVPGVDATGEPDWSLLDNNSGEDMIAWITQGGIADRTQEALGLSDKGIILYRKQLKEQMEKVRTGQDPMNVFRDPAFNQSIKLRLEEAKLNKFSFRGSSQTRQGGATKYSPILKSEE
ncbi:MAG TPA: aromatic ring-hydroxylating dioxygenase subunit alpha, partial [Candidatus Binatia bacterium]|nr:aromatic ring-hydroxylating dioxygenase subunit alpha [Candidatus Binatia bacterium]